MTDRLLYLAAWAFITLVIGWPIYGWLAG